MNMIGVKWFAEMEFWFALIKVAAIALFLIVGVVFGTGTPVAGHTTGMHLITENGGMFPHGLLLALVLAGDLRLRRHRAYRHRRRRV